MSCAEVGVPVAQSQTAGSPKGGDSGSQLEEQKNGHSAKTSLPVIRHKRMELDVRSKPLPTSLQSDFIPEDILLALTIAAPPPEQLGPISKRKNPPKKAPAAVWSHPKRRDKFRHLMDSTVCMCGAGRDISFLYDVPKLEERLEKPSKFDQSAARADSSATDKKKQEVPLPDTLVPDEYHIVKNKGVLGLEYHDEPYSTHVEDHEKHLVVFPSMNPTSRYEVVQLKKTMDSMLEKAGIDVSDGIEPGQTQMHKLLELIKSEQDIYNIVFHEVIRQVSVECIERGELLGAVRQRYSALLGKVPRQVKSLHEEVMAQRALDRRLTEELMHFKFTIGSLTQELTRVKDHDKYVSQQAIAAQDELKRALADSEKNASLLAEYHDLYELQRKRLEFVVSQLTSEKELWSVAAYCLALKVTEEKNLQTAKRLQLCEKSWQKLANHFTILLSNEDTGMLTVLQGHVDRWRDLIESFNFNMKRRDDVMMDQMEHFREDVEDFRAHFATSHFTVTSRGSRERSKSTLVQKVPDKTKVKEYFQKLKNWEELIQAETEKFGGDGLLSMQDELSEIRQEMEGWTDTALKVFSRHTSEDGEVYSDHESMLSMNESLHKLLSQYEVRLVGDNGVARSMIAMSNLLEIWSTKLNTMLQGSNPLPENDWLRFYHLLDEWGNTAMEVVGFIGSTQNEDERNAGKPHLVVEYIEAVKMTQRWVSSATNGINSEDSKLSEQVATLHTEMTKWMVQMLLRIAPDKEGTSEEASRMALLGSLSVHELKESASNIFLKLHTFTHYVVQKVREQWADSDTEMSDIEWTDPDIEWTDPDVLTEMDSIEIIALKSTTCCDNIVKEEMQIKMETHQDNAEKEYQDLMQLKSECDEWIKIAIILVEEMSGETLVFTPIKSSPVQVKEQIAPQATPSDGSERKTSKPQSRESHTTVGDTEKPGSRDEVQIATETQSEIVSETDKQSPPITMPQSSFDQSDAELAQPEPESQVGEPIAIDQEPITDKLPDEQPISEEQPDEQPITDKQSDEQPISDKQSDEQPISDKQSDEQPISNEQPGKEPIADEQPSKEPITDEQIINADQSQDEKTLEPQQTKSEIDDAEQPKAETESPQPEIAEPEPEPEVEKGDEVQWLSDDKNTYYKPLEQDSQQAPPKSEYKISSPVRETPDTKKAYDALSSVDKLQEQVLSAETRAQHSEDSTRELESNLESANEKIRALERLLAETKAENDVKMKALAAESRSELVTSAEMKDSIKDFSSSKSKESRSTSSLSIEKEKEKEVRRGSGASGRSTSSLHSKSSRSTGKKK